ncbi:hypothetical protein ACFQJD_14895 [Haloplanus sp. GCM10025708]|uniref:DUF7112 family protein n=1 Tax=Haloferacaceae TaxID=1644056 RepID=UPI00360F0A44
MSGRVASDNDAVTTYRARLARSGGTRRPCLRVPDDASDHGLDAGDLIRLALDGDVCHARVDEDANGLVIRGAYDNRRLAKSPGEGENRLAEWVDTVGRDPGESVAFDEVEPGYFYGVRVPGHRAIYDVPARPNDSLAAIAERLEE